MNEKNPSTVDENKSHSMDDHIFIDKKNTKDLDGDDESNDAAVKRPQDEVCYYFCLTKN